MGQTACCCEKTDDERNPQGSRSSTWSPEEFQDKIIARGLRAEVDFKRTVAVQQALQSVGPLVVDHCKHHQAKAVEIISTIR